ncbi:hypothetical protein TNCT_394721 [Trichonephila clavata]|uniref:Uncharacterized protein n=1 Tax=Trichonephila clavata TaxID=2740835 RepID=A0A8X6EXT5_TRICU|nr:hypothetical protein TNCT_394721 [Trichonephila clavata]
MGQISNDTLKVRNLPDSEEEEELLDESKDGKNTQCDKNIRNAVTEFRIQTIFLKSENLPDSEAEEELLDESKGLRV